MSDNEFRFVFSPADYEATVAFYRDSLELPIVGGWDRGPEDKGALFAAASGIIEVLYSKDRQVGPLQGAFLLLAVDDVDAVHRRLRARGVTVAAPLSTKPWGHRSFSVRDPDGIILSMFSHAEPAR